MNLYDLIRPVPLQ